MDGTIVDSIAATERTWARWAAKNGVDNLVILHGRPAIDTVRSCFPDASPDELERLWLEQVANERQDVDGVIATHGALDLLEWLDAHDIPWAVVTSADRPLALARLGAARIDPVHMVTIEDVERGKPHPEPFERGAGVLGIPIAECLAVEDAPAGVQAAMASGAVTAALNGHPGHIAIGSLADLLVRLS